MTPIIDNHLSKCLFNNKYVILNREVVQKKGAETSITNYAAVEIISEVTNIQRFTRKNQGKTIQINN